MVSFPHPTTSCAYSNAHQASVAMMDSASGHAWPSSTEAWKAHSGPSGDSRMFLCIAFLPSSQATRHRLSICRGSQMPSWLGFLVVARGCIRFESRKPFLCSPQEDWKRFPDLFCTPRASIRLLYPFFISSFFCSCVFGCFIVHSSFQFVESMMFRIPSV